MRRDYLLVVIATAIVFVGLGIAVPESSYAVYPNISDAPTVTKTGEKDVAVIVAVENYFALPPVAGARQTAADWRTYLRQGLGVGQVFMLHDNEATREEMAEFAERAAKAVKPGGTVWWVFIGHGAPSKGNSDGVVVGVDGQQTVNSLTSRGLPQSELLALLGKGKQKNTVLVVDACFSGKSGSGASLVPGAQPVIPVIKPSVGKNTVILSAAKSDQIAGGLPGAERPAFSYLLLGALRGWGDLNGDGTVTASEAADYTQRMLLGVKGRLQSPELFGNGTLALARNAGERDPGVADVLNGYHGATKPVGRGVEGGSAVMKKAVVKKSEPAGPSLRIHARFVGTKPWVSIARLSGWGAVTPDKQRGEVLRLNHADKSSLELALTRFSADTVPTLKGARKAFRKGYLTTMSEGGFVKQKSVDGVVYNKMRGEEIHYQYTYNGKTLNVVSWLCFDGSNAWLVTGYFPAESFSARYAEFKRMLSTAKLN